MGGLALILLDTNVWIWFHTDPSRLPGGVAEAIQGAGPAASLSAISLWELALALEKGRLESPFPPSDTVRRWLDAAPFRVLPVDAEIALLSRSLAFAHEDPADRFIAATAILHRLPLATTDARLLALPWLDCLPRPA